jgi:hypothetical protein
MKINAVVVNEDRVQSSLKMQNQKSHFARDVGSLIFGLLILAVRVTVHYLVTLVVINYVRYVLRTVRN